MKSRKPLALFLSLALSLCLCACGEKTPSATDLDVPDYSSCEDSLMLGMFVGIPNVAKTYDGAGSLVSTEYIPDEQYYAMYRDAKAAGFTFVMQGYGETYDNYTYALRAIDAAEQAGIGQLIDHPALRSLFLSKSATDDQIIRQARLLAADYIDSPAFFGHNFRDEPLTDELENLGRAERLYRQAFPGKMFYINLLPVIAGTAVGGGADYNGYLDEYFRTVSPGYVSYDHYPLLGGNGTEKSIEETFLYNMELVQSRASVQSVDFYTILQAIGYGGNHYRPENAADLAYQAYSALAYGARGFQWFCYGTPPLFDGATVFTEGIIDRMGQKTDLYDWISGLHAEVRAMEKTLLSFSWKGVMTVEGTADGSKNKLFGMLADALTSHGRITSVTATEDTLIGVFRDGADRDGFFAVNQSGPWEGRTDTVVLSLRDAAGALVLQSGESRTVGLSGEKLTLELGAGQGAFVIPLKVKS